MAREIEISDDVAEIIDEIGGTFDTVDDVLRRVLEEAGYEVAGETWSDADLRRYFAETTSDKQQLFLTALAENGDEWVPKGQIIDRIADELGDDEIGPHTLDGVQSSLTRRCQTAGYEKFWERTRLDGRWGYRIKDPYRDIASEYWTA